MKKNSFAIVNTMLLYFCEVQYYLFIFYLILNLKRNFKLDYVVYKIGFRKLLPS